MKFKRAGLLTKLLILILLIGIGVSFLTLRDQIAAAQEQEAELAQQAAELKRENDALENDIKNSDDPAMLERIAREKLGLVLPGAKIFVDVSN